ncbi:PilZ domain-containing protein [Sphingomonas sp. S1-29]|uniref:PilZ domain-containing protein n=1 Tax=Sphingomonas qomolangmaensis TaxID=2918765 RepID=A0ABY5L5V2_9SPHN|nr:MULTISPECIES: PilZ domain-containing protein [Sphingomonas]UUL81356.1 PilZ domain-containing protein [Sphingomonas qomolangmaensis]UZK70851.1 PilZ domain-containing protein [Sphingomonas sp. S1-29]
MATRATRYRQVDPALFEGRSAPRHRVVVTRATVRRHGEEAVDAELKDLSIYGCRILVEDAQTPGDRLWLRFTGAMPVAATVVWCEAGVMGCRFDEPLASSTARALTLG